MRESEITSHKWSRPYDTAGDGMRVNPVLLVNATVCWGEYGVGGEHELWVQDLGVIELEGRGQAEDASGQKEE